VERYVTQELAKWQKRKDRLPLILNGARQVGKTWIMKKFGAQFYENVAYVNFDRNERMQMVFSGDFDTKRLLKAISIETGETLQADKTLIIFDEIQEVPNAISSLKYFAEDAPEYSIIAAGSLLGVTLHQGVSFPVGKVEFLKMYPMTFSEFLMAISEDKLLKLIQSQDDLLLSSFASKLIELLKIYYFVGGMPAVIKKYVETKDFDEVRHLQNQLLIAYEQDFSKHAPNMEIPRIQQIWNSIPAQLAKENKKFVYGALRSGAKGRDYERSIGWLVDTGLVHKISLVEQPSLPLSGYQKNAFKLYFLDVGLLAAKSDLPSKVLIEGNRIFVEFKGAFAENYVLQEMIAAAKISPYYWKNKQGTSEVDFIFQKEGMIYPLEVKAEQNLKAKSLKVYDEKYHPKLALRASMADYERVDWVCNIPLYYLGEYLQNQIGV
jgi:predicted AAA+ superfamily ATPase